MYTLKLLTTLSIILLASLVTSRVSIQLDVSSEQNILSAPPKSHISSGLDLFNCATDSDILKVSGISIDPDPPLEGTPFTIKINGTTIEPIREGSYATVTVKSGLTTVLSEVHDICKMDGIKCPLSLDKEEVAITFKIGDVDAGKYKVNIRAKTGAQVPVLCIGGFVTVD